MKLTRTSPPPGFMNSLATSYDAAAQQREQMGEADWRWPIASRFRSMMRAEGKQRLLEIGAGVGFTSQWFADRGADVVATDLSPAQVELCRAKGLEAHVRDMFDLGFPVASFDAVWAMNCVHHVPSDAFGSVLGGIRDVLAPGGLFYLGVWGGYDAEGMYDDDFYPPPRFFCLRSDETLRRDVGAVFVVESFDTFVPEAHEDDGDVRHMQSLVLRRP
jgi:SAM-dependent methyltransferase